LVLTGVLVLCLLGCNADVYIRSINNPVCTGGTTSCSIIGRDNVNGNAQNTNISTIRLEVGSQFKATYSYQASNQNNRVIPITAQAEITFVSIAEWVDTGDNIPQDAEMTNFDLLTPPATATFPVASYGNQPTLIPFATRQTVHSNFTATCFVVNNDSFSIAPDYYTMSGYGAACHLQITKSTPIAPSSRIALRVFIDTSLAGSGVSTSFTTFPWSVLSPTLQGTRVDAGDAFVMFGAKGQLPSQGSSQTTVTPGNIESTSNSDAPNEHSVYFGLVANNEISFSFDIGFEPHNIIYANSAASLTVPLAVLVIALCVSFGL